MIRPLCASVTPLADESLISLIARAAVVNEVPSIAKLLQFADVVAPKPAFTPFTQHSASGNIASLLGVDPSTIEWRMHRRVDDSGSPTVDWFGTPLERRFIEAGRRRYSAAALQTEPYGRLSWMIKPLHYCSETLETLSDRCPGCQRALDWVRTRGIDRCEKCGSSLDGGCVRLDRSLAVEAVHIANLLHHLPEVRNGVLAKLPTPFRAWSPGEVLAAVVDLGAAASNPQSPHNDPLGHQIAMGDFSALGQEGIFLGWRLIQGWPSSLVPLVEAILSANPPRRRFNATPLGPLARHLHPNARPTKFRNLLRATMPEVLALISTSKSIAPHLEKHTALAVALTAREATKLLGVTWRTLRRLDHRAQRLTTHAQSRSAVKLYDREMIRSLVEARAAALEPAEVAKRLGVPAHVIPFLQQRRLLTLIECGDVILLTGRTDLTDRGSVEALEKRVIANSRRSSRRGAVALERALRHQLNPSVWLGAIEQILSGELRVSVAENNEPLARAVYANTLQLCDLVPKLNVRPTTDTSVRLNEASALMRVSYPVLSKAVQQGLVERLGGGLSLWSLLDFQSRYVFPAEVADWFSGSGRVFCNEMRWGGAEPALKLCTSNIWERRDVVRIFPESGKRGFQVI